MRLKINFSGGLLKINTCLFKMQTPTTAQLRTAIEVLAKLGERLNSDAAYSINQLPKTPLGTYYARSIEVRALEQTARIENIAVQLQNWCGELCEHQSHVPVKTKAREDFRIGATNAWLWIKNFTMPKILSKTNEVGSKQNYKIPVTT